jgi:hypothetical protein
MQSLVKPPKYEPTKSSDIIAREQAFYNGQLWALEKLEAIDTRYKKGGD